ncbi:MAG TPA: hypothetical protein VGR00_13440, partial [Thermoanaerobaculia bacterium]|nr:hypothetical protein [Thermoanaerobaculia bacterium]
VVDKREATPADVIRLVVNRYPVLDLSVGEPDIEEVVARIYRENAALRRRDEAEGEAAPDIVTTGIPRIRRG